MRIEMKLVKYFILLLLLNYSLTAYSQDLIKAVKNKDYQKIEKSVTDKTKLEQTDENGATPLMWAVFSGNLYSVKVIYENGAKTGISGIIYIDEEKTAYCGSLLAAAVYSENLDVVEYLIETCKIPINDKEYNPETKTKDGWTALQWAAYEGNNEICEYLISQGADINAHHTADNGTPLLWAIQNQHYETANLLLENGADVNIAWSNGYYPIHLAASVKQPELVKNIIKNGAILT